MTFQASCQHRPDCDGCPLFELDAEASRKVKIERIQEAFRPYAGDPDAPSDLVRENVLGYRNRARMVVEGGRLGFYRADSRELVPIQHCLVHHHELEAALAVARRHIVAAPLRDAITHIDARRGEHASVITLIVSRAGEEIVGAAKALAAELAEGLDDWGVSIATSDPATGAVSPREPRSVVQPTAATMAVGPLRFEAPSAAFYQVNDAILEAIHQKMKSVLPPELPIIDAYCGVGTHGIALADGRALSGFDSNPVAIDAARKNAQANGVEATFRLLDDTELSGFVWPDTDCVTIANPSRAGFQPQFIDVIAESPTTQFLYLSCEPHTLARDLERLRRRGFTTVDSVAFDMMPRTSHVETLVTMRRAAPPQLLDEGAYEADKSLPSGVSGPRFDGEPTLSVWFARVVGRAPHGSPPQIGDKTANIAVKRLRNIGDHSVIRIEMAGWDVKQLRQRLRRWGHPIVGDTDEGLASVNAVMERNEWLDRPLLHAALIESDSGEFEAPVPAELIRFFRLPEHQLRPRRAT